MLTVRLPAGVGGDPTIRWGMALIFVVRPSHDTAAVP